MRLEEKGVGVSFMIFDVAIEHFSENKNLYSFIDTTNLMLFGVNKVPQEIMRNLETHILDLASRKTSANEERRRAHYYLLMLNSILKNNKFSDAIIPLVSGKVLNAIKQKWLERHRVQHICRNYNAFNNELSSESRQIIENIIEFKEK